MTLPFADTKAFSNIFLDYINQDEFLKKFYDKYPNIENFILQIEQKKSFSQENRQILVKSLQRQYQELTTPTTEIVTQNIENLLLSNTFTVTTGHQLTFLGSPAYFVYKILTTIKLAQQLKEKYPQYNFVPVYWLASEDHDFEEVNHTYLFGKKYTWHTPQSGAVGDFAMHDLENVFAEMPQNLPEIFTKIKNIYLSAPNLSVATRTLVNEWFGEFGLVSLDANEKALKEIFRPVMQKDIFTNDINNIVKKTSEQLAQKYKPQINPREINFFYLGKNDKNENFRERFIHHINTGNPFLKSRINYAVLNQNITFTKEELGDLINASPEKFSPNVVLRPLYQEQILPNLAYIGGPGELAYWLQLKDMFDEMGTHFPILMPRNFATIFPKNAVQKLEKMNLLAKDLFLEEIELKKRFLQQKSEQVSNINTEKQQIEQAFTQINQKTELLDKSLVAWAGAEQQKIWKIFENIEKRLEKTEEIRSETEIKQLFAMREKIMPEGTLQERKESFLSFWLNNPHFLHEIYEKLDVFCFEMYIF